MSRESAIHKEKVQYIRGLRESAICQEIEGKCSMYIYLR